MAESEIFSGQVYYAVVGTMAILAPVVFFVLQRISAGYGMMFSPKWGPSLPNRAGWILMEAPAFVAMLFLWLGSGRCFEPAAAVVGILFLLHYFQRSFVFPLLMRGKSRMPVAITAMGVMFNIVNAYMIGAWIFYISPDEMYGAGWLLSPQFICGVLLFFVGMAINIHSDGVIRGLRRPGDTRHYIPRGGMYRYVTSANYFGEFVEWTGYAILTWSLGGAVFALWTFANLAPRARRLHKRYLDEFGDEYSSLRRRYILPFIY